MRALIFSAGFAVLFTLLVTPLFIRLAKKLEWGQFIREDGPQSHLTKRGTPTMGGIVIIFGTCLGYLFGKIVAGESLTESALLLLFLMTGLGFVGFLDDFIKVRKHRSLGLNGWAKLVGQLLVACVFAVLSIQFVDERGLSPASTSISFLRDLPIDLATIIPWAGIVLFVLWVYLIVASASNGVNVADGLDGLATGASIIAIGSYVLISFWQFNQWCWNVGNLNAAHCYEVRDPLDVAVVGAALTGALIGFLWWNTSPAQLFMGDTGSLAIGGALAGMAILTRTELLLLFIGGIFVIVAGSVIVQRVYFKLSGGKRVFLMSPLHHHFELKGWAPITVVVRFWIIAGICASSGIAIFYFEWLTGG